jgi:hypothetical protein
MDHALRKLTHLGESDKDWRMDAIYKDIYMICWHVINWQTAPLVNMEGCISLSHKIYICSANDVRLLSQ